MTYALLLLLGGFKIPFLRLFSHEFWVRVRVRLRVEVRVTVIVRVRVRVRVWTQV